jgi:hypothetical protein
MWVGTKVLKSSSNVERYGFSKDRVRELAMKLDENIVRARRIASTRLISSIFHSTSPGGRGRRGQAITAGNGPWSRKCSS